MSALVEDAATSAAPEAADVEVRVEDLLLGTVLERPVYDTNGLLLLAEGSVLTKEFRDLLRQRKTPTVRMSHVDAARSTLDATLAEELPTSHFTTELSQRIDAVIDRGMLFVRNDGPPAKSRMVFHGRKAFDTEKREHLLLNHQATSESLDSMMREAARGKNLNGRQITQLAASYLTDMTEDSEQVLSVALDAEKRGLGEHSLQTSLLAMAVAVELGLNEENVRLVGVCGLVQDWGMTKVPSEVLKAPGRLGPVEFHEIKKHPVHSLDLLERIAGIPGVVPLVAYQIHERPNGTGYPRGRKGNAIHLFARILHVADAYTALTTPRVFRPALTPYAAMECLVRQSSQKTVDPKVVTALLDVLSLFPIGSFVALSDGSVAQVLRPNKGKFTQPIVQVVRDRQGQRVAGGDESLIDLAASELSIAQAVPTPGKGEIGLSPDILAPRA